MTSLAEPVRRRHVPLCMSCKLVRGKSQITLERAASKPSSVERSVPTSISRPAAPSEVLPAVTINMRADGRWRRRKCGST